MMRLTSALPARRQRLKDRIVLGIDRQDDRAGLLRPPHEQGAGAHQALLVGERDGGAALQRRHGGAQAGGAGDRGHDPLGRAPGGVDDRILSGSRLDARIRQRALEFAIAAFVADDGEARAQIPRKLRQRTGAALGGDRLDPEPVAILAHEIEGARADRAGRAEQRNRQLVGARGGFGLGKRNDGHWFTTATALARRRRARRERSRSRPPRRRRQGNHPGDPSILRDRE